MNSDSIEKLERDIKYIGFENLLTNQLAEHLQAGSKEFLLSHQDAYNVPGAKETLTDRMVYDVRVKEGDVKYFLNGMNTTIVKNMPVGWEQNGISLSQLEGQLHEASLAARSPAGVAGNAPGLTDEQKADLLKVYDTDSTLFYKLTAIYMPAIEPILLPEHKEKVMQLLANGFQGQIRSFDFAPFQKITRIEAYNLMDSIEQPRAVHKTYFSKRDRSDDPDQEARNETYNMWRVLGYDKDAKVHTLISYGDNYKMDLLERLHDHKVHMPTGKYLSDFLYNMQKGHRQGLLPLDTTQDKVVYFHVNIPKGQYALTSEEGKPLERERYLTPAAIKAEKIQDESRRVMTVPTRPLRPGGPEAGAGDEKKNSVHQRVLGEDNSRRTGQHP